MKYTALGQDHYEVHRTSLHTALSAYGLRRQLPKTYELSQLPYLENVGTDRYRLDAGQEIRALIELKSDQAYAAHVLD